MADKAFPTIDEIAKMKKTELRRVWEDWFPGERFCSDSRELMAYELADRIQAKRLGRSAARKRKRAAVAATAGRIKAVRQDRLRPGTTIVRTWRGAKYEVEVLEDGVRFDGEEYDSLSEVARLITGTRWNGPRFFGLRDRRQPV